MQALVSIKITNEIFQFNCNLLKTMKWGEYIFFSIVFNKNLLMPLNFPLQKHIGHYLDPTMFSNTARKDNSKFNIQKSINCLFPSYSNSKFKKKIFPALCYSNYKFWIHYARKIQNICDYCVSHFNGTYDMK